GSVSPARASARAPDDQTKAHYLLNFVHFVEWPERTPSTWLTLCFLGGAGVLDALSAHQGEALEGNRHIDIRALQLTDPIDTCNVASIGEPHHHVDIAGPAGRRAPILTVSDSPGFTDRGGMIEIFTHAARLRFRINLDNARRAGLNIH